MKSPRSSLASRYSVAFILCLSCLMILMASAISGSRTSPLATAASARAEASATPGSGEPTANMLASPPAVTTVTATKTHTPSGNRAPGDSLFYTVVITNTGGLDATGVNFTDTIDPNTAFVPGSLNVSPIAVNDSYNTIGNVNISVPAPGLLANDLNPGGMGSLVFTDINGSGFTSGAAVATTHGTVNVFAGGSFTYNPNAGFTGPTDTFTYTINNGTGLTDSATVTINVAGLIWFVDDTAGPAGDGRLGTPFRNLVGGTNPLTGTVANDVIFIYTGTSNYTDTGTLTLTSGEKVIGQGATQSILTITGFTMPSGTSMLPSTGGSNPVITGSNITAITLNSNNGLHGITIGDTGASGTDLMGSNFGNLTVNKVSLTGTGEAMNLFNGTIVSGATFGTVESNGGSAAQGMQLSQVGGSFTITTTNMVNPTGSGIDVQNSPSGSNFNFGSTTVNKNSTTGIGVKLATNTGATLSFSSLAITTNNGAGMDISSSGTVNVTTGSISATGGAALDIDPTALGMTFTTVSSTNSSSTGITLTSVSGSLSIGTTTITNPTGVGISEVSSSATVNYGNATVNGSGSTGVVLGGSGVGNTGTITFGALNIAPDNNKRGLLAQENTNTITTTSGAISTVGSPAASGLPAVEITRTSPNTTPLAISLTSVSANGGANGIVLTNTNGSFTVTGGGNMTTGGDSSGGVIQNSTGHGIALNNVTNPSFTNMNIHDTAGSGINGTRVTDFTFANGTINIVGTAGTADDANISFNDALNTGNPNVTGTVSITNSILNHARYHGVDIQQDTGTLSDVTISGNTFTSDLSITTSLGSAVRLIALGNSAATTVANITKATLSNNTIANFNTGAGFVLDGGNSQDTAGAPSGTFGDPASATNLISVTGNHMDGGTLGVANQPDRFVTATVNGRGQGHFDISNNGTLANPIKNIDGVVIELSAFGHTTVKSHINNNFITSNNAVGSAGIGVGSSNDGLTTTTDDAVLTAFISGNNISLNDGPDILAVANGASTCTLNVTIVNNTCAAPNTTTSARAGIRVDSGNSLSNTTVCLDISGNDTHGSTNTGTSTTSPGINLRRQTTGVCVFGIKGMAATSTPGVENFVNAQNTSTSGTFGVGGTALLSGTTGFSNCASSPISSLPGGGDVVITSANPTTDGGPTNSASEGHDILHAARGEAPKDDSTKKLTQEELNWIVQAAIARWVETGISAEDLARLQAATFETTDLPQDQIASLASTHIKIDETGAGYGWFFDQTPNEDSEFDVPVPGKELQTTELSPAHGKMDLLTVVMRELGAVYLQGKKRTPKAIRPLMKGTLSPAVRRLPDFSLAKISPPKPDASAAPQAAPTGSGSSSLTSGPSSTGSQTSTVQTASRVTAQSGETVSQALGTIPVGEKITLKFQVTINSPLPPNVCSVTNPAAGSGFNVTGSDFTSVTIAPDSATIVKPPIIGTCPTDITMNTGAGVCTAVATFATPTSDACPAATVTCSPASGFAFAKGVTTVTCTAANGNPPDATCMFTVTVNDNQAPVITGCTNIATNTAPGVCTAAPTYAPTATDNCDGVRPVTCNPTSGSTFAKGVTTVTCMSSDANTPTANTSMCTFTVTVTDNQAPIVTCPPVGGAFAASDCLPSQRLAYTGPTLYSVGPNTVTNVVLSNFTPCTPPPVSGMATINFTGVLTGDYSTGGPPTHFQAPVTGSMKVTFNNLTGSTRTFDTEMLQLDISGGNLPAGVQLRESPALTSTGQTKITTVTGGFHIDSFFDVFTELSTNSGGLWTPDPTARHIAAVQSTDAGACNAVVTYPDATATDNCPGVSAVTCDHASGSTFAKGTTTVTCSATDAGTLTGNCSFTVTVLDTQLPALTCPSNINVIGNTCQNVSYSTPVPSDNCPSPTVLCAPLPGTCFAVGTTTVTCTATDMSANTAQCTFTVTVTPCTINCPGNITDNTAPGTCAQVENFAAPMTTGMCGTVTCSPLSGSSFPKGVTTVTCSTTAGPSCSFTVTINDNELPTVTCPSPITQNTDLNLCSAVVSFTATVNDNCPGATPSCSPTPGSVFPKGITTVFCKAIDASNNLSPSCTFTVTVVDNQAPTVVCPSSISKNTDPNLCTAVATYITPTGSDNCAVQSVVCSPASGTAYAKGVTTVTCTVTDTANLTGMCTFTVTVVDNQAPTVNCPAPITQNTDPGVCTSVVNYTTPTGSDNCPLPPNPVVCSPASATAFAKGVTTVTCTVTDAANLTGNCAFTVTVVDNQAPTVVCPNAIAQNTDPNLCSAIVSYTTPTGSDNCPLGPTPVVCSPASGSVFPKGITTVTCTVTDTSSLTGNCMFTVTVNDNQAPTVTCPANITQAAASNQCSAVVTYANATATDNCAVSGSPVCAPASGSTFQKGVTTVTCTVSDTSSNVGSCTFTVTINDTTPPVITCPGNVTHGTDPNVCNAVVTYPNATATDNCTGVGTPVCTPASGTTFAKGVTTVTCNVTDASSNPASCTFTVTVNDTQNPTVTCPNNITFTTPGNSDLCGMVTYATPAGSDNCAIQSVVCTPTSGTCFPLGMTTVTCTAKDTSNNMGQCTFKITVSNPCTITCPANITENNDLNQCGAVTTFAPMTTGGGCGTVACTPASGSFFPKGTTTVTCTTSGPSCSFTVTVNDTQPPNLVCADVIATAAPSCPIATNQVVTFAATATDNCAVQSVVCNPPSGATFPVGTTSVTCTATDTSGNVSMCSFTATVFSFCLQDDSSPGDLVFVNAITGDYLFCSGGVQIASGRGTLTVRGCQFGIEHTKGDRKVHIGGDTSANNGLGAGTAVITKANGHMVIQITDRNMTNNTCSCSSAPPQALPRDPDPGKRLNGN